MKKTFLIFMVICTIMAGIMPGYEVAYAFKAGNWATESIELANTYGIIPYSMYAEDYTMPVTRADIAEIVVNAYENVCGEVEYREFAFSDVYSDTSIYKICTLGIMNGKSEDSFAPYDNVTREEMAKIISEFKATVNSETLNLPQNPQSDFSDFEAVSDWAKPYVSYAKSEGIISGFDDNTFRGKTSVSAEMAIVLVLRCASYNAKEKPLITSLTDGSIVPSGTELNVSVAAKENCNLYLKNLGSYSQIYSINYRTANGFKIDPFYLNENSAYVLFAECGGVFSDAIKIYTDSVNIPLSITETESDGIHRIYWEGINGIDTYNLKITESRNSYYEGDIHPKDPVVYTVQGDFVDLKFNVNRIYTIEISGGGITTVEKMYIPGIQTPEHEQIESSYPTTQQEALDATIDITVPVWRIKNGQKVAGTAYLRVHKLIADKVKLVFEDIFNGPEKFPIKDVGAYAWRGGRSEHNGGTAIDINANENFCIYENGTTIGSYWKPYEDVYSITPYGDVVTAFEKHGFTWGGDAWRNPRDYMHFSYLGT